MRVLTVPNWSFARERALMRRFEAILGSRALEIHYLQGDVDHNRTVTAFSGEASEVLDGLSELADAAFETIDLARHTGVHPRIGALDVCPFVPFPNEDPGAALALAERFARDLASRHGLPIYLYERSERGRHEADLPSLRRGGFGGLLDRELRPDYGPSRAHPRLGVTVVGVRDFLIATNVNLAESDPARARSLAAAIRRLRTEGDPRFLGVRALGLPLASRGDSQVSMNLTLPDLTPVDPIVEWVRQKAADAGVAVVGTELIGVIRDKDVPGAQRLPIRPSQIVKWG